MAFSTHDIVPDSPTNTFATLNPLATNGTTTTPLTISDGNLKTTHNVTGQWQGAKGTISVSSGIWYFEVVILQVPTGTHENYNIGFYNADIHNGLYYGLAGNLTFGANASVAQLYVNTSSTSYGSLGNNGSIYMFCLDVDSEKFWVGLNGSWFASGNPSTGVNPSASGFGKANWTTVQSDYTYSGAGSFQHNYGQDPTFAGNKSPTTTYTDANGLGAFYYQPPDGALALCTANLSDFTPTVTDDVPQDYFKAVTYSGQTTADAGTWDSGTSTSTITVGFQPDFVWLKQRNPSTTTHQLLDVVRGKIGNAASFSRLRTDTTATEATPASDSGLLSMGSNGFTLGTDSAYNDSGSTYVAWCWKAGGPPDLTSSPTKPFAKNGVQYETLSAANITAGTITPTAMSVNTDAGFSIVKYTGTGANATVPHGLTTAPEVIIVKNLDDTGGRSWIVYHHQATSTPQEDYLLLNEPDGFGTQPWYWNDTYPTSSVFSIGIANAVTYPSQAHIAYCWHSVEGYSKFGSYTGNGSPDGPFIYCGFRPAFVMVKCTSTSSTMWIMFDSERDRYNVMDSYLQANDSLAEVSYPFIDFLSNGFKHRHSSSHTNATNDTYIFMAFAEQPFKFSNAR